MGYYRASGIYQCKRRLLAVRLGVGGGEEAPPWLEQAAREGSRHEQWIKDDLRATGIVVVDGRDINGVDEDGNELPCPICLERFGDKRYGIHVEIEHREPEFIVFGHMDGRDASIPDIPSVLEVKTFSHFEFERWMRDRWEGFPTYANQLTIYMTADKAVQALYVAKNRSSGKTVREFLGEPPRNIDDILVHIGVVEEWAVRFGTPDIPAEFNPASIECKRCPYTSVLECVKPVEISGDAKNALLHAEADYVMGKTLEKEAKGLIDGAKEVFAAYSEQEELAGRTWKTPGGFAILRRYQDPVWVEAFERKGYWETRVTVPKVKKSDESED